MPQENQHVMFRLSIIFLLYARSEPINRGHRQTMLMCWQHLTGPRAMAEKVAECKSQSLMCPPGLVLWNLQICIVKVCFQLRSTPEDICKQPHFCCLEHCPCLVTVIVLYRAFVGRVYQPLLKPLADPALRPCPGLIDSAMINLDFHIQVS